MVDVETEGQPNRSGGTRIQDQYRDISSREKQSEDQ
jgi:hypothetical protein